VTPSPFIPALNQRMNSIKVAAAAKAQEVGAEAQSGRGVAVAKGQGWRQTWPHTIASPVESSFWVSLC
jgi:hypothetical protein